MFLKLERLYSKNNSCKEINFTDGVNIILGEKLVSQNTISSKQSKKTNGVGKSMAIETIRFCLLQDFSKSRLSKIPEEFIENEEFYLDMIINNKKITIARSIKNEKSPEITIDGESIKFSKLDDACEHLLSLLFTNNSHTQLSFRQLLAPLMREEECEFKEIIKYYSEKFDAFEAIKPQAYIFGIDLSLLKNIKYAMNSIKKITEYENTLIKEIENSGYKIKDVHTQINSVKGELKVFEEKIEQLETNLTTVSVEEELAVIITDINSLQIKQARIINQIQKIKSLPIIERIDTNEIKKIYNYYVSGMGELIKKSFDEVLSFNSKIQNFQSVLMGNKLDELNNELNGVQSLISQLEQERAKIMNLISNQGLLKDFKNMFSILQSKQNDINTLEYRYNEWQRQSPQKRIHKAEKEKLMIDLDNLLISLSESINKFNEELMRTRNEIMGNTSISFQIQSSQTKGGILDFILRADSDGSHSVDRVRTFTYDISLMVSEVTRANHLKYLVHDNIFDVDQNSLIESLNLLGELEKNNTFQYILTINKDRIYTDDESKLTFDLESHKRLELTKSNRFFNFEYKEK